MSITIQHWSGGYGVRATLKGYPVVMTPKDHTCLDNLQSDRTIEHYSLQITGLKATYEFEPLPKGADPTRVKGAHGNLRTEEIFHFRYLQYMLWPSWMALAEYVWKLSAPRNGGTSSKGKASFSAPEHRKSDVLEILVQSAV